MLEKLPLREGSDVAGWKKVWRPKLQAYVYVLNYYDINRHRKNITAYSEQEKDDVKKQLETEPGVDPSTILNDFALEWLRTKKPTLRIQTYKNYESLIKAHIIPVLGDYRVGKLKRPHLRNFLTTRIESGLKARTVQAIQLILNGLFTRAMEDGLVDKNPAAGLSRSMNLGRLKRAEPEKTIALTEEQLNQFLMASRQAEPKLYPLFFTMARTGMRPGEAVALQWDDIDFQHRRIHVRRSAAGKIIQNTKTGQDRFVDMSRGLLEAMHRWKLERTEEKLKKGWDDIPPWIFLNRNRTHFLAREICYKFTHVVKHAKLPLHHSPKSLRHTFASRHLMNGADMVWVQRQLGHTSIKMTVDTYAKWFSPRDLAAADRLDDFNGQGDLF